MHEKENLVHQLADGFGLKKEDAETLYREIEASRVRGAVLGGMRASAIRSKVKYFSYVSPVGLEGMDAVVWPSKEAEDFAYHLYGISAWGMSDLIDFAGM